MSNPSGLKEVTDFFAGKRVLVTGHTGFKGTWLVRILNEIGSDVYGISDKFEENSLYDQIKSSLQVTEYYLDILDRDSLELAINQIKPDVVFHFAAKSIVRETWQDPVLAFQTNVMGTINVLDVVRSINQTKYIAVSTTDKVYKNSNQGKTFVEGDELWGHEPYSASKVGTELAIATWRKIYEADSCKKLISLRAGNVIGGGDLGSDRLIPDFIRAFEKGTQLDIRNPSSTRPWQHVLDCLYGYLSAVTALSHGIDFDSINIGPAEESISVAALIATLNNFWEEPVEVNLVVDPVIQFTESNTLNLDSSLAISKLKWRNALSSLDAIRITGEWWQAVLSNSTTATEITSSQVRKYLTFRK